MMARFGNIALKVLLGSGYFGVLFLVACGVAAPGAQLPEGAVRFDPPAVYRAWWNATERCSGHSRNFSSVSWYVDGTNSIPVTGPPKVGLWYGSPFGSAIVVAGSWTGSELVVRHEMLHHLLRDEHHPAEYFVARCHLTWESFGHTPSHGAG